MQEEVTKHTKKIFKAARSKHSLGEKIREILLEIAIIVFAVTLSIWLHGWSEHRHEQKEAKAFLKGLKEDLSKDIQLMEANRNVIVRLDSNFRFLQSIPESSSSSRTDPAKDKEIGEHLYFDLRVTQPNIGRYEGFKSSGKIETIENSVLKEKILIFYQQTLPNIAYGENYVNSIQQKMLDLLVEKDEKQPLVNFISSLKLKSLLNLGVHNFGVNLDGYDKAIAEARAIIEEIEK